MMLDADDLIMPGSLSKLAEHLQKTDADVILSSHYRYDVPTQVMRKVTLTKIGPALAEGPFEPSDYCDDLFSRAGSGIANKVFRMERIKSEGVHFQDVERIGDVHFTLGALATARSVEFVDIPHYYYRVRLATSLTHAGVKYPLSFAKACYGLQDFLMEKGLWEQWKIGFLNWVVALLPYNLSMMESYEACHQLAQELYEYGFQRMEFGSLKLEKCPHPRRYTVCDELYRNGPDSGIYALMRLNRTDYEDKEMSYWSVRTDLTAARSDLRARGRQIADLERVVTEKNAELDAVWRSASMRLGRAVTAAPRIARDLLKRKRDMPNEPMGKQTVSPLPDGAANVNKPTSNPLVSVIVPVEDECRTLKDCLVSICKQDFPDFEIRVVASESNEEAQHVVNDFASRDKRVVLVTMPRFDLLLAYHMAKSDARGKWLCLVNSHDYLYPEFLGAILGEALGADASVGASAVVTFAKKPPRKITSLFDSPSVFDGKTYCSLEDIQTGLPAASAFGKLYNRSRIDENLITDDHAAASGLSAEELLGQSDKVSIVGFGLYAHRVVS